MSLPTKHREEIKLGILDFLHRHGMRASYRAFREESGLDAQAPIPEGHDDPLLENAKYHNLLDKKWLTVLRLQKRVGSIMDMEAKAAQAKEPMASRAGIKLLPAAEAWKTLTGHRGPLTRLAFHPQHQVMCTASEDTTIKVWDYETGEFERTLKGHTKAVHDIVFHPKGTYLASCSSDLSLKLWDVSNDYSCVKTLMGHDHTVSGIHSHSVRYCIRTLAGHTDWVRCVQPSSDGRWLSSCSNDQSVRVWDFTTGECKADIRGHSNVVEVSIFAPVESYVHLRELVSLQGVNTTPGQLVFSAARDKTIRLSDLQGQCLHTFVGHDNWVRGLVVHPSGQYLMSAADDKTCKVWDLKTGRAVRTLLGHAHFVTCLALAPGGTVLATGSVDLSSKLWNYEGVLKVILSLARHTMLRCDPRQSQGKTSPKGARTAHQVWAPKAQSATGPKPLTPIYVAIPTLIGPVQMDGLAGHTMLRPQEEVMVESSLITPFAASWEFPRFDEKRFTSHMPKSVWLGCPPGMLPHGHFQDETDGVWDPCL
ncbi:Lissencephaly-1 [Massospora cicadina]|nr:Lissencephaly-1 [Massospora cicadina]